MKKIISLICILVLLLSLSSCKNKDRQPNGKIEQGNVSVVSVQNYSDFDKIGIDVESLVVSDNESKLEVKWTNQTPYNVIYGDSYMIERKRGELWFSCQKNLQLAFNTIGYGLEAGTTQNKTYDLKNNFDVSKYGTYRISTDCFVYDKGADNKGTQCKLWAEFSVTTLPDSEKTAIDHPHTIAQEEQTVSNPVSGYCGNIRTILYVDDKSYTFWGDDSVALTDILINLDYKAEKSCKCRAEYKVDTESGENYGINLSQGFARHGQEQADLTEEQTESISKIIKRVQK